MADFRDTQHALANAIRNPELPNVFEDRRVKIYQELFYNNVEGFCSGAFPVLKSILSDAKWNELVRKFFLEHNCESPHFIEISQEFLSFLSTSPELLNNHALLELAHYEWVELASSVAENQAIEDVEETLEIRDEMRIWVPESTWPLAYSYPVHTISSETINDIESQPTFLLVYRDQEYDIRFIETDQLTIWLINQLEATEMGVTVGHIRDLLSNEPVNLTSEQAHHYLEQALPALLTRKVLATR